ncbi:MAG: hydantoinase/carbamoylase family amidase [Gammaproteobacteria bacterium]|nr:hydantoinase/carbamoylase family amidase [Gammaproteobacteria bacterium]
MRANEVLDSTTCETLDRAVRARQALADEMFDQLRGATHDGVGILRPSYGAGEDRAHQLLAEHARALGLAVSHDAAGNTFVTLTGRDRHAPAIVVGSHLDSVAQGGNYDGAAGVVGGLMALAALRDVGVTPASDIRVMGIRAEEGEWFGASYIGSRAALGTLPAPLLDEARRADSGRTLREHMLDSGCDPASIAAGHQSLSPSGLRAFIELHIEQGPVLEDDGVPIGLVTGVRGNSRLHAARCVGEFSHCGGVPRHRRRDAVAAVAELVIALDEDWTRFEETGGDFAFTVGKLSTDASEHAMSKIPGVVDFTLDMRSVDGNLLSDMEQRVRALAAGIGERRRVRFELGDFLRVEPGAMCPQLRAALGTSARTLGVPGMTLASGASHDAAAFAAVGVPSAMLFVRNANGSHNPRESMAHEDLTQAVRVLARWLMTG